MHDDRMINLVKMAAEAEALEASAELGSTAVSLRRHAGGRRVGVARRLLLPVAGLVAAAVAVGAVWVWVERGTGVQSQLADRRGAEATSRVVENDQAAPEIVVRREPKPLIITLPKALAPAEGCVVLAIFKDAGGGVRCVRWQPHDLGGGRLFDVQAHDLVGGGTCSTACSNGAQRLLLVAMAGPADRLPRTDAGAEAMVACILESQPGVEGSGASFTSATAACVPPEVSVKVESLVMGN